MIRALCGVLPRDGPSCGSLVPLPTWPMTELDMYDSISPVSTFSLLKRSSSKASITKISISWVTRLVSSISVPIGLVTKMLRYCGSLDGKNSTFGGKTLKRTKATTIKLAVPKKKAHGFLPSKAYRKNASYPRSSLGKNRF